MNNKEQPLCHFSVKQNRLVAHQTLIQSYIKSVIRPENDVVEFCTLERYPLRMKFFIENRTNVCVAYYINKPPGRAFTVFPKMGILKPRMVLGVNFSFNGFCHRVPDDMLHSYTIFHEPVPHIKPNVLYCEFESRRQARAHFSSCHADPPFLLNLPIIFKEESAKPTHLPQSKKREINYRRRVSLAQETFGPYLPEDEATLRECLKPAPSLPHKKEDQIKVDFVDVYRYTDLFYQMPPPKGMNLSHRQFFATDFEAPFDEKDFNSYQRLDHELGKTSKPHEIRTNWSANPCGVKWFRRPKTEGRQGKTEVNEDMHVKLLYKQRRRRRRYQRRYRKLALVKIRNYFGRNHKTLVDQDLLKRWRKFQITEEKIENKIAIEEENLFKVVSEEKKSETPQNPKVVEEELPSAVQED